MQLLWRDIEKMKCFLKVFPGGVKLMMANGMFAMGGFHISAFVIVGTSSDEGDEWNLATCLFTHVCIGEVMGNPFIF